MEERLTEAGVATFRDDFAGLQAALEGVIVGQAALVRDLLFAVLAGGHVLLEGAPGLGKTYLARSLGRATGTVLSRIQCTPDLMPADVTGSEVLVALDGADSRRLEFRPGPIFASMVLVDEINRATPRCQSALLEAMQEHQVTYAGRRHPLPSPFWVLATQNPIEFEGTYPLPEAQIDRFTAKLTVAYPTPEALSELAVRTLDVEPVERLAPVLDPAGLAAMMSAVRAVVVPRPVVDAAARLVLATHAERPEASEGARTHLRYGASPRALQALLRLARVRALSLGRAHIDTADVAAMGLIALRHRVLLGLESELSDVDVDVVLEGIVEEWTRAF